MSSNERTLFEKLKALPEQQHSEVEPMSEKEINAEIKAVRADLRAARG